MRCIGARSSRCSHTPCGMAETTPAQIEDAFKRFTTRSDIAILLINQYVRAAPLPSRFRALFTRLTPAHPPFSALCWQLASQIRPTIDAFQLKSPAILEVPSKEHPYDPEQDAIHRRTKLLLGIRD